MRRSAAGQALLCVALLLVSATASAGWKNVRRVTQSTAFTAEKGEVQIGIFAPLTYGISERVLVQTHPLYDLLLTPNLAGRVMMWDGPAVVSMSAGYAQSVLQLTERKGAGESYVGPVASWPILESLAVTAAVRYAAHIDPGSADVWRHGMSWQFAAQWLATQDDLVIVSYDQRRDLTMSETQKPSVLLMYAHAFDLFHVAGGVNIGQFRLRDQQAPDDPTRAATWPIMPVIDLWWRF